MRSAGANLPATELDILLVNPAHPRIAHVSAVRAWQFALGLARRGHRVVLLTAADEKHGSGEHIRDHDWSRPYVLAPEVGESSTGDRIGPTALRKVTTVMRMLTDGGHQHRWVVGAVSASLALREYFRPDVIWATYGKMEAAIVAKRLARALGTPWVFDLKDSWEFFVPLALRRLLAWRVRGWTALTANSEFNRDLARTWHGGDATVVYSGVDAAFFEVPVVTDRSTFELVLVGGLYTIDRLQALIGGIAAWIKTVPAQEATRVRLSYIGNDQVRFEQATIPLRGRLEIRDLGFLPVDEMAALCGNAAMNLYIGFDAFHHKLLELLALGRPLLAYPCETQESRRLACEVGGVLIEPGDATGVVAALDDIYHSWRHHPDGSSVPSTRAYSWPAQTLLLEEVLRRVANKST